MITIIGATGRVGSKTVGNLLAQGKQVRLIARNEEKLKEFASKGAEICAGNTNDAAFLTKAFTGSDVVLCMMPADFNTEDVKSHQDAIGEAQIEAIKKSGVKKVVFLSSVGGHTEEKTGIVAGLARQEKRLRTLEGVDIKILRPTYFMENLMQNIGMIKNMGIMGSANKPDVAFPIIASKDIAAVVTQYLANPSFTGISVQPLLGAKDYTMNEVTSILGSAIGKPDLKYVQFSYADTLHGIKSMGGSQSMAEAYVGLAEGINEGVFGTEVRNEQSTTPTTIEEFAPVFAQVYNM